MTDIINLKDEADARAALVPHVEACKAFLASQTPQAFNTLVGHILSHVEASRRKAAQAEPEKSLAMDINNLMRVHNFVGMIISTITPMEGNTNQGTLLQKFSGYGVDHTAVMEMVSRTLKVLEDGLSTQKPSGIITGINRLN